MKYADIGHEPQLMANDALQYILMNSLSISSFDNQNELNFYPNPTNTGLVTIISRQSDNAHTYF